MDLESNKLIQLWYCLTLTVVELKTVVNKYFKINQLLVKPRYIHLRRSHLQEFINFHDISFDKYMYSASS